MSTAKQETFEKLKQRLGMQKRMVVPTDPVEAANMAIDLAEKATAGPWNACHNGECSCKAVWFADHPVAEITSGEWGDSYPAIRHAEGDGHGMYGTTVEAYLERITYGNVNKETAAANARLIAFARTALPLLAREVLRLHAERQP